MSRPVQALLKDALEAINRSDTVLSLIHISEPTRLWSGSRMPSSA